MHTQYNQTTRLLMRKAPGHKLSVPFFELRKPGSDFPAAYLALCILAVLATMGLNPLMAQSSLRWAVGDGNWDTTTANWQALSGGGLVTYSENDSVTFDDSNSSTAPITVTLTADHTPGSVTVNSTNTYTFTGSAIGGSGSLTKNGSGTLILTNRNTFTGPVTINGGELYVNPGNAGNNGALSYVSGITVNSGATLRAGPNGLFGYDGSQVKPIIVNGGTLSADPGNDVEVGLVTLNGGTMAGTNPPPSWGTWAFGRGSAHELAVTDNSTVTAVGVGFYNGSDINVASGKTLTFSGTIIDTYQSGTTLIKNGKGTSVLSGDNSYSGSTIVNAGTLALAGDGSIAGSSMINVGNGATFDVTGVNTPFTLAAGQMLGNTNAHTGYLKGDISTGSGGLMVSSASFTGGTPALTVVSGTLTLSASTRVVIDDSAVSLNTGDTFEIVSAASGASIAGTVPASVSLTDGKTGSLQISNNAALFLTVGAVVPPKSLHWTVGDGNWDTTTTNWEVFGGGPTTYAEHDYVTFDDTNIGSSPVTVTLTANHTPGRVTFNNSTEDYVLTGSAIGGSTSLVKDGSGMLTVNNHNTFTGSITVNGGTLYATTPNAQNNNAFSYVSGITINSNATLESAAGSLWGYDATQAKPITVNKGGTLYSDYGADVQVKLITLNGGTMTGYNPPPSWGSWGFGRVAGGKLAVTDDSTNMAVGVGFYNGADIDVTNNKTLYFTGTIIDNNQSYTTVIKDGEGTLMFTGDNGDNGYTGPTIINAGTLVLTGGGSIDTSTNIIIAGGATFDVTGLSVPFTLASTQILFNRGSSAVVLKGDINTGSGGVALNFAPGTPALNLASGTLTLSASTSFSVNNTGQPLTPGSYKLISAAAGATVAGTVPAVTVSGGGSLAGASLQISNAVLYLVVSSPPSERWAVGNGSWDTTTANWQDLSGGGLVPYNVNDLAYFDDTNSGTSPITVTLTGALSPANVIVSSAKDYNFMGAAINGSGGLYKSGTGTLTLSNTNGYTGATVISGGKIALSGGGSLSGASPIIMYGGALDLGGTNQTAGAVSIKAASSSGDTITNGSLTAASYTADISSGNAVVDANLLGNGGLTKNGAGTLSLGGNNAYTNNTVLNAGTLDITGGSLSNSAITVNAGATLQVDGGVVHPPANPPASGFNVMLSGATLNQTGGNLDVKRYVDPYNSSTLNFSGGRSTISLELLMGFFGGGCTVNVSGTHVANWMVTRFQDGNCNLNLLSGGKLFTDRFWLIGGSTANGVIRFDGGTLGMSSLNPGMNPDNWILTESSSATLAIYVENGGANIDTSYGRGTITYPLQQDGSSTGGLNKLGGNTLTLTADSTYTGPTIVSGGTLALSDYGSIADSSLISITNGAAFDVSGLNNPFTLGASQMLSNSAASTGDLNGDLNTGSGTLALSLAAGTPALNVAGGTLTLSSSTSLIIDNTGAALDTGAYELISAANGAAIAGAFPTSVTVTGGGATAAPSLRMDNGNLYLVVGTFVPPTMPTNVVATIVNIGGVNNVVITGSGGSSSSGYSVLTTTNLAAPMAQWSTNAIGVPFGVNGSVNFTNAINPNTPQLFYRIRVP